MSTAFGDIRKFILAQIAAESYLENVIGASPDVLTRRLRLGSNNYKVVGDTEAASLTDRLDGNTRMTDAQIRDFTARYEIVDHLPNTWSGFSGTLLKDRVTGEYTLSFRSTEFADDNKGGDWSRDGVSGAVGEISNYGFAVAQVADAEAYFRQLEAQGKLPAGAKYNVTGYSLGGHIATVFAEAHADDPNFIRAYTFNAPGRGELSSGTVKDFVNTAYDKLNAAGMLLVPGTGAITGATLNLYSESSYRGTDQSPGVLQDILSTNGYLPHGISEFFPTSSYLANGKITQIYGRADYDDTEWVANTGVHPDQTETVKLFIEDQPDIQGLGVGWLDNLLGIKSDFGTTHSITLLADSLAVADVLETLDANISDQTVRSIFSLSSNQRGIGQLGKDGLAESDSLEGVVEALMRLFGIDVGAFVQQQGITTPDGRLPRGLFGGGFGNLTNRNVFYNALDALKQAIGSGGGYTVTALNGLTGDNMLTIAKQNDAIGLAFRYALSRGNTFAVIKDTALYAPYDANGELELAGSSPSGQLSEQYLSDRAKWVERIAYYNNKNARDDLQTASSNPSTKGDSIATAYDGENIVWDDRSSGTLARRQAEDGQTVYRRFGSDAPDMLTGKGQDDHLYGGGGADFLTGAKGNDYLEGGVGFDTYQFASGDGADTVLDSDAKGLLTRNGNPLALAVKQGDGVWVFRDTTFTRAVNGTDLEITFADNAADKITIKKFDFSKASQGGYLGIQFIDASAIPVTTRTIQGDLTPVDADPATPGVQFAYDDLGNVVTDPNTPAPNRADVLLDSVGNDLIDAGGGDDYVLATRGGADWIKGGAGRDWITDTGGNNFIEAGGNTTDGGDIVTAGSGNDTVFAEAAPSDLAAAMQAALDPNAQGNGLRGDFLSSGAGDDLVLGGADNDALLGGGGADLLVGGAGDDNLFGDGGDAATDLNWTVARTVANGQYQATFSGTTRADTSAGAADAIYGGAGADWVFGGVGDDFIDGGSGNDVLFGEAGSDIVIGGTGNDVLVGDNPGVTATADEGADYLDGGAGDDILQGNGGDDILIGGAGNDMLMGEAGKDVYVYNQGDGVDTIIDTPADANDPEASVLVLGPGIRRNDIKFRLGSLLVDVGPSDANDPNSPHGGIHFEGFDQLNPLNTPLIGEIRFDDGQVMSYADILAQGFDLDGTEGDDNGHDAAHPMLTGTGVTDRIRGFGGNDILAGFGGDDVLDGGDGADQLQGGEGNDTLLGGAGDDALFGGAGDDLLVGGAGVDFLNGEAGNDTYAFDEQDNVFDFNGDVTIEFGEGLTPADLDLAIRTINGQPVRFLKRAGADPFADGMGISLGEGTPPQAVSYRFSDGAVLSEQQFFETSLTNPQSRNGTEGDDLLGGYAGNDALSGNGGNDSLLGRRGNDFLDGGAGADTLDGGVGNDTLYGGAGDDTIIGGAGDDNLRGDDGADTFFFGRGDGHDTVVDGGTDGAVDTLQLAADLAPQDVAVTRQANGDLEVRIKDTGETVTVAGWYKEPSSRIERIAFGDGTVLNEADLAGLAVAPIVGTDENDTLTGTAFDDTLLGLGGDDVLDGGAGNDVLQGGAGADTYCFDWGMGQDTITETGLELNTLQLASNMTFDQLDARRQGNDLFVNIAGSSDGFVLKDYFAQPQSWQLKTEAGETRLLSDFLTELAQSTEASFLQKKEASNVSEVLTNFFGGRSPDFPGVFQTATQNSDAALIHRVTPISTVSGNVETLTLENAYGGPSNNTFNLSYSAPMKVDAGAGNDLIWAYGWGYGTAGDFLMGGDGNDRVFGTFNNDIIVGSNGDDYLAGGDGNDTYVVLASETGTKIIDESVVNISLPEGFGESYLGGRYSTDTVEFGPGISLSDLNFSRGRFDSSAVDKSGQARKYATLDINWGGADRGIRVVMPDRNDPSIVSNLNSFPGQSWGIEYFKFADGTVVSMEDMLARAPALLLPTVEGTDYNDYLVGTSGDDIISDLAGDDTIWGQSGNDTFLNGSGNDVMNGGPGNDTYLFGRGSGQDRIFDFDPTPGNVDTVRINPGVSPNDVTVTRDLNSAQLRIDGTSDVLTLGYVFAYDSYAIERVTFADGTVWDAEALAAKAPAITITGTESADFLGGTLGRDILQGLGGDDYLAAKAGDDVLDGGAGNDYLAGEAGSDTLLGFGGDDTLGGGAGDDQLDGGDGNDQLYAGDGNDVLAGGAGNDNLQGGAGSDVYLFGRGAGQDAVDPYGSEPGDIDVVRFDASVWPEDVTVTRDNYSLFLSIAGSGDSIMLANQFNLGVGATYRVTFADGTVWDNAALAARASFIDTGQADYLSGNDLDNQFYGLGGDDAIYGYGGNDLLDGGSGNDYLDGGTGDDTYVFGRGYGRDTAADYDTTPGNVDTVRMAANVSPADVSVSRDQYNLYLSIGDGNDKLTLSNWRFDDAYRIERVEFADGTVWGPDESLARATIELNRITGSEGNDWLFGTPDPDLIDGRGGNDYLRGDEGNDIFIFGRGYGQDIINDYDATPDNVDTVRMNADVSPSDVSVSAGNWGDLVLSIKGTGDQLTLQSWFWGEEPKVEQVAFADGTVWDVATLESRVSILPATEDADLIFGGSGDDTINALGGDDQIVGNRGNDVLNGGAGSDYMQGDGGNDILIGGEGFDDLEDWRGNNYFDAGADDDYVYADGGANFVIGGPGNDWVDSYGANDLIAFNAGHGQDTVYVVQPLTLSLGGGIQSTDLRLSRDGQNLVLETSAADSIRLYNWYNNDPQSRPQLTLQTIGDAVRTYDLSGVIGQFDQLQAQDPTLSHWPLDGTLQGYQLSVSTDHALGGDLAYQYATTGNTIALSASAMQAILADSNFGVTAQPLSGMGQTLNGTAGNVVLTGGAGNDTLIGGPGDTLIGGAGSDTYVVNLGGGVDTIVDTATPSEPNTLSFGAGITPDMLSLGLGSLLIRVGDQGDVIHIENFDPNNVYGPHAIENYQFADGTTVSYSQLLQRGFDLYGAAGDDAITGTNTTDRLYGLDGNDTLAGGAGDDVLDGGAGNDVLAGGTGNDELYGGAGDDTYIFNLGDGVDTIHDAASPGAGNRIVFGEGITRSDLAVVHEGSTLVIQYGAGGDAIRLPDFNPNDVNGTVVAATLQFADGSTASVAQLANRAPTLANGLADQVARQDSPFMLQLPESTFVDADAGDSLTLSASLADGSVLPAWLSFDPASATFSGTPANDDVGVIGVKVVATDGSGATAADVFDLMVVNVNDAPLAADDTGTAQEDGGPVTLLADVLLANDTDVDAGDTKTLVAVSGVATAGATVRLLPADPAQGLERRVEYDPGSLFQSLGAGQTTTDTFTYTMADTAGATSSATVTMTITGVNDVPVAGDDAAAVQEDGILIATGNVLTNDSDVDAGTTLNVTAPGRFAGTYGELTLAADGSYTYTLNDDDAAVQSLAAGQQATDTFAYAATDGLTATASMLSISIAGANDAPVAADDAGVAQEDGGAVTFAVSALLANDTDVDAGDTTTIVGVTDSVAGAHVSVVPADSATGPAQSVVYDPGTLFQSLGAGATIIDTFTYTIADSAGATSTATVTMTVTGMNDAPALAQAIGDRSINEDELFIFQVPENTFADVDRGDALSYIAMLADGSALPAWLNFDAATRTFIGTPDDPDVGTLRLVVTAIDQRGLSADAEFNLTIANLNEAPMLAQPLSDQAANQGAFFRFQVPADTFTDVDRGDALTYRATLTDGSALPAWLAFDPGIGTFSGTPSDLDVGALDIKVTAIDAGGLSASSQFALNVSDLALSNTTVSGTGKDDVIRTGNSNDTIYAGKGDDTVYAGAGRDVIYGGTGKDALYGEGGNDYLAGENGSDALFGGRGYDVLSGGEGQDKLDGGAENDLLYGGNGADTLIAGEGNNLLIGGHGADTLVGGVGHDVFVFDRGNGKDTLFLGSVAGGNNADTLAFGAGLTPAEMRLGREKNDLIVSVGGDNSGSDDEVSVVLKGWYDSSDQNDKTIAMLEFIGRDVETFDFAKLAASFDQAQAVGARWDAMNARLDAHLASSDTEAIGGDLAYQYGLNGSLAGISLNAAQSVLADPNFGAAPQALKPLASLQDGLVKLG